MHGSQLLLLEAAYRYTYTRVTLLWASTLFNEFCKRHVLLSTANMKIVSTWLQMIAS
jgi:hypothetical protein